MRNDMQSFGIYFWVGVGNGLRGCVGRNAGFDKGSELAPALPGWQVGELAGLWAKGQGRAG